MAPSPALETVMRRLVILALVYLAFFLRLDHLDFESLWFDEASSVYLASADLGTLVRSFSKMGENGPLFFLLLKGWMALVGQGEYALRFFALLPGVLMVPLLYVLARRLFGSPADLLAALLGSVSSYLIYYSQENRMYALLALLSLLSSYLLIRAATYRRWWLWLSYGGIVTLTLYIHVFGALLLPAHAAFFLLALPRFRPALRGWLVTMGVLLLPYLPVGLWHFAVVAPRSFNPALSDYPPLRVLGILGELAWKYGTLFTGLSPGLLGGLFGGLFLLGLLFWQGQKNGERWPWQKAFVATAVFIPFLTVYALSFFRVPFYLFGDRYLTVMLPGYYLGLSVGLLLWGRRWRVWGALMVVLVVGLNLAHLGETRLLGKTLRDPWREATRYLEGHRRPGEGLLFPNPITEIAYDYYTRSPYPERVMAPPLRLDQVDGAAWELTGASQGAEGVWLVAAHHNVELLERLAGWLEEHAVKADERYFRNLLLLRYRFQGALERRLAGSQGKALANFEDRLGLRDYELLFSPHDPASPPRVVLYWEALGPVAQDYWVSLRLSDVEGQIWGLAEGPPDHGFYPTSQWNPGRIFPDERELSLLPGTPPGAYGLELRVYHPQTGRELAILDRLRNPGGTVAALGTVQIFSLVPGPSLPPQAVTLGASFGPLYLEGVERKQTVARPGDLLPLALYWRAGAAMAGAPQARLALHDAQGQAVQGWSYPLARADYPPSQWPTGRLVAAQHRLPLAPDLPSGRYTLQIELRDAQGNTIPAQQGLFRGQARALDLMPLEILAREHRFAEPSPSFPAQVEWVAGLRLLGYDLTALGRPLPREEGALRASPGEALQIRLFWRALAQQPRQLTVFVHLLNEGGRLVAQHDDLPAAGYAPTTSWLKNEVIEDTHELLLPLELPAGVYRLALGWYDSQTKERLLTRFGADHWLLGRVILP